MNIKLRNLIGAGLIISVLSITPFALAQENSSGDSGNSNDTSETEQEAKDRDDRIEKFKTKFKVNLSATLKLHIKAKCVGSQGVVGKLHTRFGNSITVRTQAYTELSKNLDKLVTKLQAKGVDTTQLETDITTLKSKIATYTNDLAAYKQTLVDLKSVDCKSDPDAFQAALEAARAAHQTLLDDVVGIKTYLKDTIKPALETIRSSLEKEESNNTEGEQ